MGIHNQMSETREIPLVTIKCVIDEGSKQIKTLLIENKMLVPAHAFPAILTAYIAGYLKDMVTIKMIDEKNIPKILQLFIRDLTKMVADKELVQTVNYQAPNPDDSQPLNFEFK